MQASVITKSGFAGQTEFPIRAAFQPIVDIVSGDVFAYEALVRGSQGQSAGEVLSWINDDNRHAFDQACRVTAINDAVAAGILETRAKLSINFMPTAVDSPYADIQLTLRTARQAGFPVDRLMFEFTEHQKTNVDHLRSIIATYRELGLTTAIDDFGVGQSGLGLLASIQTDVVKLDMYLVRGIDSNRPKQAIVEAMLGLSNRLGMKLIAEGIETEGELNMLRGLGVRLAQGYFIGRPALGKLSAFPPLFNRGLAERRRRVG
ncbi:EAL domain-containing protein [Sphingomonas rhizophila]|uniref:EAL domain-containing protein n=1 Tax=Sphingomonas rhizophila TaxID=2071607 RepID=A0A7G9SC31_9SPHN|nr:EAL domain-containing protein [Sphingomonas rhizophila]QNN65406.1 EAL domain-containing protein [Sphingomonas rhizophila]